MASSTTDQRLHAPGHVFVQFVEVSDRYAPPYILYALPEFVHVLWCLFILIELVFAIRPNVLDEIDVWRTCWPPEDIACSVHPGIDLLKDESCWIHAAIIPRGDNIFVKNLDIECCIHLSFDPFQIAHAVVRDV